MNWSLTHPHEVYFCVPFNYGAGFAFINQLLQDKFGDSYPKDASEHGRYILASASSGIYYEGRVIFRDMNDAIEFKLSIPTPLR